MARIRTIKPDFFRHEALQDLEAASQGKYPMLVFAGLWGHCDKAGRFEWRPRTLKLDILPFLDFNMVDTLELLVASGFIRRYSADGGEYGVIPTFAEHQRIGGKESEAPEKFPEPPVQQPRSTGEAPGIAGREGKGREGNGDTGLAPGVNPATQRKAELRKTAGDVIAFLNAKAGRKFDVNGANADHVIARLRDGETLEDLRAVIAMKVRDWKGDEKMAEFLRPETLFNRTKFASYKGKLGDPNV